MLLAEDNELSRKIVIELLNNCRIEIICAENKKQG